MSSSVPTQSRGRSTPRLERELAFPDAKLGGHWHSRSTQPMTRWLPGARSRSRGCPSCTGGLKPKADHTGLGGGSFRALRCGRGVSTCVRVCVSPEGLGGPGTRRPLGACLLSSLLETEPPPPSGCPGTGQDVNPRKDSRKVVTCPLGLHFSSVQLLSCVRLSATTWTTVRQASLSITSSRSLQVHRHSGQSRGR